MLPVRLIEHYRSTASYIPHIMVSSKIPYFFLFLATFFQLNYWFIWAGNRTFLADNWQYKPSYSSHITVTPDIQYFDNCRGILSKDFFTSCPFHPVEIIKEFFFWPTLINWAPTLIIWLKKSKIIFSFQRLYLVLSSTLPHLIGRHWQIFNFVRFSCSVRAGLYFDWALLTIL